MGTNRGAGGRLPAQALSHPLEMGFSTFLEAVGDGGGGRAYQKAALGRNSGQKGDCRPHQRYQKWESRAEASRFQVGDRPPTQPWGFGPEKARLQECLFRERGEAGSSAE